MVASQNMIRGCSYDSIGNNSALAQSAMAAAPDQGQRRVSGVRPICLAHDFSISRC